MWGWAEVTLYFSNLLQLLWDYFTYLNIVRIEWGVMILLLSSCVNQPVAADQRTTYWTSWTLLPLKASLSSLPAANRGWYNYLFTVRAHFNYIHLMSFHFQLKRLSGSSSCPYFSFPSLCLYFCLTSVACWSYQETELFEIIEKLQVSYSVIDLQCVYPVMCELRFIYHWCSYCPSGQQDRWAAVSIPSTSEG